MVFQTFLIATALLGIADAPQTESFSLRSAPEKVMFTVPQPANCKLLVPMATPKVLVPIETPKLLAPIETPKLLVPIETPKLLVPMEKPKLLVPVPETIKLPLLIAEKNHATRDKQ